MQYSEDYSSQVLVDQSQCGLLHEHYCQAFENVNTDAEY